MYVSRGSGRSTVVTNTYAGEKEDLLEHSQIQGRGLESGTARGGKAQLSGQKRAAKKVVSEPSGRRDTKIKLSPFCLRNILDT